jgi:hypothetical protein
MAEPVLNSPRIVAVVGQLIAAGVAQHMDVDRERQPRTPTNALDKPIDGVCRKRAAAFGGENVGAVGLGLEVSRDGRPPGSAWRP